MSSAARACLFWEGRPRQRSRGVAERKQVAIRLAKTLSEHGERRYRWPTGPLTHGCLLVPKAPPLIPDVIGLAAGHERIAIMSGHGSSR